MSKEKISISRVAQAIDVSTQTLKNWYKWYEDDEYEKPIELKLPEYFILDGRGTKFFNQEDIAKLLDFKNKLQMEYKGVMAVWNAEHQWGTRGAEILQRKEEKSNE